MFNRTLKLPLSRSFFLFGPRGVGKSTLLKVLFQNESPLWLDLLDPDLERQFSRSPSGLGLLLEREITKSRTKPHWVVIDEVQKVPELLNVVQAWMSKKQFHFALTGSSARKLKRGGANLLAGRASWFELFGLSTVELGDRFEIEDSLNWGSLPEIFSLNEMDRIRYLKAYAQVYLKEEILAEQLVRKAQPFREFLTLAALQNAQIINFSKFGRDCGVDTTTVQNYFEILCDTLVGFLIQPYHRSIRKRQRTNPKFYFFDTGVTRALAGSLESKLTPQTTAYGKMFEQFVVTEIYRRAKSLEKDLKLSYLTTKDQGEIDLIVEQTSHPPVAIEIKSSRSVDEVAVRRFSRLASDIPKAVPLWISQDPTPKRIQGVECLPWNRGIEFLMQGPP